MLLDYTDVKFVQDNVGTTQEVILRYNIFQDIEAFLARHSYFYSETVQQQLKKADADVEYERYIEVTPNNIEDAIAWLHE